MNSHDRRKYRRQLAKAGKSVPGWAKAGMVLDSGFQEIVQPEKIVTIEPLFVAGQIVRLNTDRYGKSYFAKKTKATVLNCIMDAVPTVEIQLTGRKAALVVFASEVDLVSRD